MTLCLAPWANLDISPQGHIGPCCKFQSSKKPNIQTQNLEDYFASDMLKEIKKYMLDDRWHPGCVRCQTEEKNNIASMRQLSQPQWQQHPHNGVITASIAFGNTCNLKCITCGSHSSSKWYQEYRDIYNADYKPVKFFKNNLVQTLIQHAPNLVHLDIPGGEPFLSGIVEQKEILQHYINTGHSSQMSLHYTTNATMWPDQTWWNLWSHFKQIEIQLSIDGVGVKNEYIRFPSRWEDVVNNAARYTKIDLPNFKLSVSHTLSAYNVFYLDEFVSWCYTMGLPKPWIGNVHKPSHMRPSVWPNKSFILNKLKRSSHDVVFDWIDFLLGCDDSEHFEQFKIKTAEHDQYRGVNFASTFPELNEHMI